MIFFYTELEDIIFCQYENRQLVFYQKILFQKY